MPSRDLRVNIEGDEGPLDRSVDRVIAKLRAMNAELDKVNRDNKRGFTDLGKSAQTGADMAQGAFGSLFGMIGKAGPANIALLAAAVAALPTVAGVAAVGITSVLGGALVGVGLMAAAQSSRVKGSFEDLVSDIKDDLSDAAEPLEDSLIRAGDVARRVFGRFEPQLAAAFDKISPHLDRFVDKLGSGIEELAPTIQPLADAFGDVLDELGDEAPGIFMDIRDALLALADAASANADDFAQMIADMAELARVAAEIIGWLGKVNDFLGKIGANRGSLFLLKDALNGTAFSANAVEQATEATNNAVRAAEQAFGGAGHAAGSAKLSMDGLAASLDKLNGPAQTAEEASLRVRDSLLRVKEAAAQGGAAWSLNTAAGVRNRQMILSHIQAIEEDISAQAGQGKSVDQLRARWTKHRAELIRVATQLTGSRQKAVAYVDSLLKTPKELKTTAKANTSDAKGKVSALQKQLNNAAKPKTTTLQANTSPAQSAISRFLSSIPRTISTVWNVIRRGIGFSEGGPVGMANGGRVHGPGGSRADRIPAMLSRGEFVMNADATRRNLPALEAMNSGHAVAGGGGGTVNVSLVIGGQRFGEVVIDTVRKEVRTRGGDVQSSLGGRR